MLLVVVEADNGGEKRSCRASGIHGHAGLGVLPLDEIAAYALTHDLLSALRGSPGILGDGERTHLMHDDPDKTASPLYAFLQGYVA